MGRMYFGVCVAEFNLDLLTFLGEQGETERVSLLTNMTSAAGETPREGLNSVLFAVSCQLRRAHPPSQGLVV